MSISSSTQDLISFASELQVVLYIDCASLVVLGYNHLLTFDQELRLIWHSSPWNCGKLLFCLARYLALIAVLLVLYVDGTRNQSVSGCEKWTQATVFTVMFQLFIANVILTLRVWVAWKRNRIVTWILATAGSTLIAVGIWSVAGYQTEPSPFGQDLHEAFGICPPFYSDADPQSIGFLLWIAYDSVIFLLTFVQAWGMVLWRARGSSLLVKRFFTDGLTATLLILAISIANITVRHKFSHTEYVNLLTALIPTYHSIFTTRMMLNLRERRYKFDDNDTQREFSALQFAIPTSPVRPVSPGRESPVLTAHGNPSQVELWFGRA